jgi:hypothetical protein
MVLYFPPQAAFGQSGKGRLDFARAIFSRRDHSRQMPCKLLLAFHAALSHDTRRGAVKLDVRGAEK